MLKFSKLLAAGALFGVFIAGGQAQATTLPLTETFTHPSGELTYGDISMTYGDFQSYSLPILAYWYDQENGGGTGPGNPFYVASSPGSILDYIVVATGATGTDLTTNYDGIEDAYATPNKTADGTGFTTGTVTDPVNTTTTNPVGDMPATWDADIAALNSFLDGGDLLWMFNNNEFNRDAEQDILVWALVTVWSFTDPTLPTLSYEFTNTLGAGVADGAFSGDEEFVLSGGDVCMDPSTGLMVTCGTIEDEVLFAHNLGANQVAYAVTAPDLNDFLRNWTPDSGYDTLSLDFRLANIGNGYEQLFIISSESELPPIPEPSTLLLLGSGLVGLGLIGYRRRK